MFKPEMSKPAILLGFPVTIRESAESLSKSDTPVHSQNLRTWGVSENPLVPGPTHKIMANFLKGK